MITVYRAGNSSLHRLPVWTKLLVLTLLLLAISILGHHSTTLAIGATLSVAAFLTAGFGIRGFARQVWAMRWLLLIMLVPGLIFLPWQTALINTTRLVECVLLASVFSFTTKTSELLAAIERAANPLRRIGVNPQAIGLVLTMTISSIPLIIKFAANVREAQVARGVRPNIVRTTIPLLVASLKHSDDFAEALMARGVEV